MLLPNAEVTDAGNLCPFRINGIDSGEDASYDLIGHNVYNEYLFNNKLDLMNVINQLQAIYIRTRPRIRDDSIDPHRLQ